MPASIEESEEPPAEDVDPFHNNQRSKKYEYKYDANGNLTCEYKREVGASKAATTLNYTYDALNRLTSAKEPPSYWGNATADRTYQYDSLGNLVYEQDKGKQRVSYQYNNLNQLTHKTVCDLTSFVEDSHEYRYTYDKRGNLVLEENCERTTQGNKWLTEAAYAYNAANRLAVGTNAKGEKSVYTYNGLGQRVRNEYIVQDNGYDYTTFDCTPPSVEVGFETPEVVSLRRGV